jgi:2-methylcitrate dehydratase PrpD
MGSVTEAVAKSVVGLEYEQLSIPVVKRVKQLILDAIGVALAGSSTFEGSVVLDLISELGGNPEATLLSKGTRTSSLQLTGPTRAPGIGARAEGSLPAAVRQAR